MSEPSSRTWERIGFPSRTGVPGPLEWTREDHRAYSPQKGLLDIRRSSIFHGAEEKKNVTLHQKPLTPKRPNPY